MRAAIKRAEGMERTKWQTVQESLQHETLLLKLATYSMFKLTEKNIGTETMDYWDNDGYGLWPIRNYGLHLDNI